MRKLPLQHLFSFHLDKCESIQKSQKVQKCFYYLEKPNYSTGLLNTFVNRFLCQEDNTIKII